MGTYTLLGWCNACIGGKDHLAGGAITEDDQDHDTWNSRIIRSVIWVTLSLAHLPRNSAAGTRMVLLKRTVVCQEDTRLYERLLAEISTSSSGFRRSA